MDGFSVRPVEAEEFPVVSQLWRLNFRLFGVVLPEHGSGYAEDTDDGREDQQELFVFHSWALVLMLNCISYNFTIEKGSNQNTGTVYVLVGRTNICSVYYIETYLLL